MFEGYVQALRERRPLVHNITNYVTVNDCANATLAIGASPIMADDIAEVEDIVSICDALVLNIGTLNQRTVESMILAGKRANELSKPVILDPVGNGASVLRTRTTNRILEEVYVSVIRGNMSEIRMAYEGLGSTRGVDTSDEDLLCGDAAKGLAMNLAKRCQAVVAITGPTDYIADANVCYAVSNGHPSMSRITGAGCMCTSVTGAFCAALGASVDTVVCAVAAMGIAGEIAYTKSEGTGGFRSALIDALSRMNDNTLSGGIKIVRS